MWMPDLTKVTTAEHKASEAKAALAECLNAERQGRIAAGKVIDGLHVMGTDETRGTSPTLRWPLGYGWPVATLKLSRPFAMATMSTTNSRQRRSCHSGSSWPRMCRRFMKRAGR